MPAITPIAALPHYISREEHRKLVGSTPQSFSDIPAVLRHKEEDVMVDFDPPISEFEDSQGTLYVIERYVL